MANSEDFERREFLEALGVLSISALGLKNPWAAEERRGEMLYRQLGRTGERVSAIGLGGYHLGVAADEKTADRMVRTAVDRGVNFMDNSWDYNDDRSERWMGHALRDGYRQKVFLMTKFDGRTKTAAAQQLDESLKRLETDHVDLWQFHENIRMEDPDRFFAEGGAVEAVRDAKKAGKIRYVGFTGHKDPQVHLRMLDIAHQHNFHFDTAQMPLNILDAQFRSFAHLVVPKLVDQGIGVLGMKPMASGAIPQNNIAAAVQCLHYALSLPTSVVITGCESPERVDQAIEAVRTFKPLTKSELSSMLAKTRAAAESGNFERFKTGVQFDATASHPEWLG
jgi:aryl-alcohol dehydrogenase-like predicted oxidoreductase